VRAGELAGPAAGRGAEQDDGGPLPGNRLLQIKELCAEKRRERAKNVPLWVFATGEAASPLISGYARGPIKKVPKAILEHLNGLFRLGCRLFFVCEPGHASGC